MLMRSPRLKQRVSKSVFSLLKQDCTVETHHSFHLLKEKAEPHLSVRPR